MADAGQLVRDYRAAERRAAVARDALDAAARGAALRRTMLGDVIGTDWPAPLPGLSRRAQATLAVAERDAAMRLATLADLVGAERAASLARVSRQRVVDAYRLTAGCDPTTDPPGDANDQPLRPPAGPPTTSGGRRRWPWRAGGRLD